MNWHTQSQADDGKCTAGHQGVSGIGSLDDVDADDTGNEDISHSSLVSVESDEDSFQLELDAELDRQLDEMIGQTSYAIDCEIQQHLEDQLNAQFEDYMEDYFHRSLEEEEMKQRLQVVALSKERKESSKTLHNTKTVLAMDPCASNTTTVDVNAQIQQVIAQYKAKLLLEE